MCLCLQIPSRTVKYIDEELYSDYENILFFHYIYIHIINSAEISLTYRRTLLRDRSNLPAVLVVPSVAVVATRVAGREVAVAPAPGEKAEGWRIPSDPEVK